eukprot:SAG11_NODE_8327_length_1028_cov_1.720129_2_plen_56_part_00
MLTPTLTKLWRSASAAEGGGGARCELVAELAMDTEAHTLAGAPAKLVVNLTVHGV